MHDTPSGTATKAQNWSSSISHFDACTTTSWSQTKRVRLTLQYLTADRQWHSILIPGSHKRRQVRFAANSLPITFCTTVLSVLHCTLVLGPGGPGIELPRDGCRPRSAVAGSTRPVRSSALSSNPGGGGCKSAWRVHGRRCCASGRGFINFASCRQRARGAGGRRCRAKRVCRAVAQEAQG